jgi:formiminotetrahydrofolate cyclodeaminase
VASTGDYLDLPLRQFLDRMAAEEPTPAGGSAAAIAVAMASALIAKVAKVSTDWPDARAVVAQAERLSRRIAPLAQSDAEAYEEALAALHLPDELEPEVRSMALGQVLSRAAEIPLVIAEAGADVACLAAEVADRGAPDRRGDAIAAALIAEAAARAAANLVAVNLTVTPDDERLLRAEAVSNVASAAARDALRTVPT